MDNRYHRHNRRKYSLKVHIVLVTKYRKQLQNFPLFRVGTGEKQAVKKRRELVIKRWFMRESRPDRKFRSVFFLKLILHWLENDDYKRDYVYDNI